MASTAQTRLFVLLFASALISLAPNGAAAEDTPPKRTVSVSATGTVKVAPDTVNISTGVESDAPSAKDALARNTAAMSKVVDALKESGIEPKDIQTTNFAVEPRYEGRDDNKPAKLVGYHVTNSVYITVRDVAKLGDVLDKVVSLGANSIGGVSFGVSNPEALEVEARKLAMSNALTKAKLYAEGAGAELGPVQTISEQGGPQPNYERAAAPMAMAAKAAPIEAGTADITMQVNVTWELK